MNLWERAIAMAVAVLLAAPTTAAADIVEDEQAAASFHAWANRSPDLRARIALTMPQLEGPGTGLPDDRLVDSLLEQARGSTDPAVLSMLLLRCTRTGLQKNTCDRVALARRWVEADTQNQVAWLALAVLQKGQGDLAAAKTTFERAARASLWKEQSYSIAQAIVASLPADLTPARHFEASRAALAIAYGFLPMEELFLLSFECKDEALRPSCLRIVETMHRDADSMMSLRLAAAMTKRYDTTTGLAQVREDQVLATEWGAHLWYLPLERYDESRDPADLTPAQQAIDRVIADGERLTARRMLDTARIEDATAARDANRYREAAIARARASTER